MKPVSPMFRSVFITIVATLLPTDMRAESRDDHSRKSLMELVAELKTPGKRKERRMLNELMKREPRTQEEKDFLLKSLDDDDSETQVALIALVVRGQDRRAVPKLIKALEHRDIMVQEAAMDGLADIGDEEALAPLAGRMPDPSKYEPKAGDVPDPFMRELLQQLKWMNANLFEMRNNIAMLANWVMIERERAARAKAQQ